MLENSFFIQLCDDIFHCLKKIYTNLYFVKYQKTGNIEKLIVTKERANQCQKFF